MIEIAIKGIIRKSGLVCQGEFDLIILGLLILSTEGGIPAGKERREGGNLRVLGQTPRYSGEAKKGMVPEDHPLGHERHPLEPVSKRPLLPNLCIWLKF